MILGALCISLIWFDYLTALRWPNVENTLNIIFCLIQKPLHSGALCYILTLLSFESWALLCTSPLLLLLEPCSSCLGISPDFSQGLRLAIPLPWRAKDQPYFPEQRSTTSAKTLLLGCAVLCVWNMSTASIC